MSVSEALPASDRLGEVEVPCVHRLCLSVLLTPCLSERWWAAYVSNYRTPITLLPFGAGPSRQGAVWQGQEAPQQPLFIKLEGSKGLILNPAEGTVKKYYNIGRVYLRDTCITSGC